MHCGMCLPTCPTYDATLHERSSPRGRIAMMRAIADGELEASKTFAEEMYFCLGCLACQTACPAGVDYAALFENARAEVERQGSARRRSAEFCAPLGPRLALCQTDAPAGCGALNACIPAQRPANTGASQRPPQVATLWLRRTRAAGTADFPALYRPVVSPRVCSRRIHPLRATGSRCWPVASKTYPLPR